jgi:hypothetical protein
MVHVYALSRGAKEKVSTASKIATDVASPNSADVDLQGRFPAESMTALEDMRVFASYWKPCT